MDARCRWVRIGVAIALAAAFAAPVDAMGSPARRLARRGVIVAPPGSQVILPPAPPVPPAVVVGPGLRPRRRLVVPPVAAVVPGLPGAASIASRAAPLAAAAAIASRGSAPAVPAPPAQAAAAASPARSSAAPASLAPEEIPAPNSVAIPAAVGPRIEAAVDVNNRQPTIAGNEADPLGASPFTPAWYARHPQAWQPAQSADWWQPADAAAVASWLNPPVVRAAGNAATAVVAQPDVVQAGGNPIGADGLQSVLVLPAGHDRQADGSARAGTGDWLPLGVFAVVPPAAGQSQVSQGTPHNYQQLAIDRSGAIRGNFYDAISDTTQPITGSVDPDGRRASWTVGAKGSRFTAAVAAFTSAPRTVDVAAGGTTRSLALVPVARP